MRRCYDNRVRRKAVFASEGILMTRNLAGSLPTRLFTVCFSFLLVVGVGLRFFELDKKSLWADELFTFAIAKYYPLWPEPGQPLFRRIQVLEIGDGDTFLTVKAAEQSPPLNDLLEKAAISVIGSSEFAARLPAAVASCALLFWFAGFAWHHPDPGVRRILYWSVLLLAFYPLLILYAKEGRAYSVGASLIGMAGLLWMLRWRIGGSNWQPPGWLEICLFTLACFAHYNAALLAAILLLPDAVMATKMRSGKAWLRLLVLATIFSMWIALNIHAVLFTSSGGASWGQVSTWEHVARTLRDALTALHWPWLVIFSVIGFGSLQMNSQSGTTRFFSGKGSTDLWVLIGLTTLYIGMAGVGYVKGRNVTSSIFHFYSAVCCCDVESCIFSAASNSFDCDFSDHLDCTGVSFHTDGSFAQRR
jgi:hypothetical protein